MVSVINIEKIRRFAKYKHMSEVKEFSDDDLLDLVDYVIAIIEMETGRVFKKCSKQDFKLNFTGNYFNTQFFPILKINEITLNKQVQNVDNLKIDYKNGIIFFPHYGRPFFTLGYHRYFDADIMVDYEAGYWELPLYVEELVIDMIFVLIKAYQSDIDGVIHNVTEDKLAVGYDTAKTYFHNIDDRLAKLRGVRMGII